MADAPEKRTDSDIAVFGDKDISGAYEQGTMIDIGGEQVDLSTVPDVFATGGKSKAPAKP